MKITHTFLILLLASVVGYAQDQDLTIDDYYVDFSVPDITAFSILDINTNNVVRPGNVKEFTAGIQNYIDKNGNLKPGLAIEIAPYRLLSNSKNIVTNWDKKRSLKNLQISIATAQGDSTNLLAAWGINWTPFDMTDPVLSSVLQETFKQLLVSQDTMRSRTFAELRNQHLIKVAHFFSFLSSDQRTALVDCFAGGYEKRLAQYHASDTRQYEMALLKTVLDQLNKFNVSSFVERSKGIEELVSENTLLTYYELGEERNFEKYFTAEVKKQKKIFIEENWNRLVVQFKTGAKYNSLEASLNDLNITTWRLFGGIAGRFPGFGNSNKRFAKNCQVVYQANYTSYRDNGSLLKWEFSTGGRVLYGKADKRFSCEFQYSKAALKSETNEMLEYIRYTIGGEIKISDGLWFELAVGGQKFLQGDVSSRLVPEFGIKYAIQKKTRF